MIFFVQNLCWYIACIVFMVCPLIRILLIWGYRTTLVCCCPCWSRNNVISPAVWVWNALDDFIFCVGFQSIKDWAVLPGSTTINWIFTILNWLNFNWFSCCAFYDWGRNSLSRIFYRTRIGNAICRVGNNVLAFKIRVWNALNNFVSSIRSETNKSNLFLPSLSVIDRIFAILNGFYSNAGLCCIGNNGRVNRIDPWISLWLCWLRNNVFPFMIRIRDSLNNLILRVRCQSLKDRFILPGFAIINGVFTIFDWLYFNAGGGGILNNRRWNFMCSMVSAVIRIGRCSGRIRNNVLPFVVWVRNTLDDFIFCIGFQTVKDWAVLPGLTVINGVFAIFDWLYFNASV